MSEKRGILLVNVGTPAAADPASVRNYLREFLMDPHVIDIPYPARWLLVHGLILRRRPARSAALYAKIWTERGSPLLNHSQDLRKALQALMPGHLVAIGMRYGQPTLRDGFRELIAKGARSIEVLPLYPQYSLAATASCQQALWKIHAKLAPQIPMRFHGAFYADPGFIKAFAAQARPLHQSTRPDHVVFTFHGLPERQIRKTDSTQAHCFARANCCDVITEANRDCYRAQSFATARLIAAELGLAPDTYTVSFQSRLGRTPWIKPWTDEVYPELARRGLKRLLVLSPSFVADCLETLEEIAIRGRDQFVAAGGEDLVMVPSLNASPAWVQALAKILS